MYCVFKKQNKRAKVARLMLKVAYLYYAISKQYVIRNLFFIQLLHKILT